ncbi:adhesin [Flavobacterium branchiophilum]|uniref:Gliding motility-associated-like protein n=1 Tax=Flavobacterium branchiophilum TaxID=55197 RepID=A0A543G695_9FLAO|nr:choice-of-anchor L domain-containing protein [Flavobacterium branchiophilum]OXA75944.1 adhesin [Flavobacterium branchiophilum] [Flavobacterium branchiophilum NBRC 15030 = ATCC 35035]TQM41494.1 gliding motility-associated-like protein [Flavobacterium branchiophilum]GEM54196.1 hypothetical protein FB1_04170 [Flavobacterium branchiophilum NBRC 15030 = ATCC 35035]
MKGIFYTLIAFLFTFELHSQSISVSTTTHTIPQLVNNVLINSNCVSATNISSKTGTNFGSVNGIGYFQNTNPNFPIQSGVILSTGNALNAVGPNNMSLNDGNASWIGDTDLENTLAQSGITMQSANASMLEFDFTPIASNFTFDFVFASEEYGNFQCQFSDSFAFLLTNTLTGVTTNLAVVPNTNLPISVVTIRNNAFNSNCASANAQYFGSYNGGAAAASSATNFNGQTVLMNASAVLVPNTPYHIKLVVADRSDSMSDSAIFLSSNSFNFAQNVLGPDITGNNAICFGSTHTINSGLNPAIYNFIWKKNGVVLSGQTGPSLSVIGPGTYTLTYSQIISPCDVNSDSIVVDFLPEIITPNPINLGKCDVGTGTNSFNLAANTSVVNPTNNPNFSISYHNTLLDANTNANPLSSPYSTSATNETIFIRIKNNNTGCFTVKSFNLLVSSPPVANQPNDLVKCERTLGSNDAIFDFSVQNATILGTQSATLNVISYYTSQANANLGINPIVGGFLGTTGTTIYARIQNFSDTTCFATTSFHLIVKPKPSVPTLQSVVVCSGYPLPHLTSGNYFTGSNGTGTPLFENDLINTIGTTTIYIYNNNGSCNSETSFTVTIIDINQVGPQSTTTCDSYTLPLVPNVKYYTGPNAGLPLIPAGTVITSSQTIYLNFQSTVPPICQQERAITITINNAPVLQAVSNVFECTSYQLPPLAVGNYYTQPNGGGTMIPALTTLNNSQTIYVYAATNTTPPCTDSDSFKVGIGLDPIPDVSRCVSYTLPALTFGKYYTQSNGGGVELPVGYVVTYSQDIYVRATSASGCADEVSFHVDIILPIVVVPQTVSECGVYNLPELNAGNYYTLPNGGGVQLPFNYPVTNSRTVYVYINNGLGCQHTIPVAITIKPLPVLDPRGDVSACNTYTLTPLTIGNYYTESNGGGNLIPFNTVLNQSQTVHIYAVNSFGCPASNSFNVSITHTVADTKPNVTQCDQYVLEALNPGNRYFTHSQMNGQNGQGIEKFEGDVIETTQTIYIYKKDNIREDFYCEDEKSFVVTINHTPVINPIADVFTCDKYILPPLEVGNYFSGPNGTGQPYQALDEITEPFKTLYVYAETGTVPNCTAQEFFNITVYNVSELPNVTKCSAYVLPTVDRGQFYNNPNATGQPIEPGTTITQSQTLYIIAQSPYAPFCTDVYPFDITIVPAPIIHAIPAANSTICDNDGPNDGIANFDLTTLNTIILGNQNPAQFTLQYFANMEDLLANQNSLTNTTLPHVFVKLSSTLTPNCTLIQQIDLFVKKRPEPELKNGTICIDNQTGAVTSGYTILSGLDPSLHTFQWFLGTAPISTNSFITVTQPGTYNLIATNVQTGCVSALTPVQVIVSQPAWVTYTTSDAFSENQTITITATGTGTNDNYEYQLDNAAFQSSPTFYNVSFGLHYVTVKDKNGCSNSTIEVIVADYPRFFTPNGDGINDTWNINNLNDQPDAYINIYDKYGKFLIEIKPSGSGWDGNINGRLAPADDFWFAVFYKENNTNKVYQSHFAIKR